MKINGTVEDESSIQATRQRTRLFVHGALVMLAYERQARSAWNALVLSEEQSRYKRVERLFFERPRWCPRWLWGSFCFAILPEAFPSEEKLKGFPSLADAYDHYSSCEHERGRRIVTTFLQAAWIMGLADDTKNHVFRPVIWVKQPIVWKGGIIVFGKYERLRDHTYCVLRRWFRRRRMSS